MCKRALCETSLPFFRSRDESLVLAVRTGGGCPVAGGPPDIWAKADAGSMPSRSRTLVHFYAVEPTRAGELVGLGLGQAEDAVRVWNYKPCCFVYRFGGR